MQRIGSPMATPNDTQSELGDVVIQPVKVDKS
jgi:hypothetical protein